MNGFWPGCYIVIANQQNSILCRGKNAKLTNQNRFLHRLVVFFFFLNFDWRPNIQDLLPNSRDTKSHELCSVVFERGTKV